MALGPKEISDRRSTLIASAEQTIDSAIRGASGPRVTVDTRLLRITRAEWDQSLRPKYLSAGWKKADWTGDQRDGDFIDLEA